MRYGLQWIAGEENGQIAAEDKMNEFSDIMLDYNLPQRDIDIIASMIYSASQNAADSYRF